MTRFIRCSEVDEAAVIDLNSRELTVGYRRAVAAALPEGIKPSNDFWHELADAIAEFFVVEENRLTRIAQDLKRREKIIELIDELNREIRSTYRPAGSQWTETSDPLLRALHPVKRLVEHQIVGHRMMVEHFGGTKNPHREFLYEAVFDLWYRRLGMEMEFSRTKTGGPLIRFLAACINPLLVNPLTARGISKAVERVRARRITRSPMTP